MRKRFTILIAVILAIIVASLIWFMAQPKEQSPAKASLSDITKTIIDKHKESGMTRESHNTKIDKVVYHQDRWLIVVATHLDEPPNSDLRMMAYVLERQSDNSLKIIAMTYHGFHDENFPEGTPSHLIERAESV